VRLSWLILEEIRQEELHVRTDSSRSYREEKIMTDDSKSTNWFFAANRRKVVPVDWPRLRKLAAEGQLRPTDMVLRAGTSHWQPASSVEGLFTAAVRPEGPPATVDQAVSDSGPPGLPETVTYRSDDSDASGSWWPSAPTPELPPVRDPTRLPAVPGYRILGELGRGGMGVVYKAEQVALKRTVALKMILAGAHAGSQLLERFRTEAEAIARLQHPNIVQIHEVGTHEGLPFFSLEFCAGGSLGGQLDGTPLPPPEAAGLVESLARAVQAAHEQGIVHRDLKPANVLLSIASGQLPLASESPEGSASLATDHWQLATAKITDFGLAKLAPAGEATDRDGGPTQSGAILGTPSYMAPEQALGKTREVGPAVDIYALGAILYELLTGRPPFRGATLLDTLEQVRVQEPVAPSRLQPQVPRDLETICLKCLEKEPARRYATAAELADDLGRFLRGEPTRARPVGALGRAGKWARRRPAVAGLSAAVVFAVVVGLALVLWQWREAVAARDTATTARIDTDARAEAEKLAREDAQRAHGQAEVERQAAETARGVAEQRKRAAETSERRAVAEKERAEHQLRRAEVARYAIQIDQAQQELRHNQAERAAEILAGCRWDLRDWEHRYLWGQCQARYRSFGQHTLWVERLSCQPDGRHVATASGGLVRVWDAGSGKEVFRVPGVTGRDAALACSPDGKLLAVAAMDQTVKLYDAATGREVRALQGLARPVTDVCFDAAGKRLAAAGQDQTVKVWDPATGKELLTIPGAGLGAVRLALSPDGKHLATAGIQFTVKIWDAETGKEVLTLRTTLGASTVCYSPDGKRLATGGGAGPVQVWDAATGQEVLALKSSNGVMDRVRYSPDGKRLAACNTSWRLTVWDAATGVEQFAFPGYSSFDFSPDGKHLAAGHFATFTVRLLDLEGGKEAVPVLGVGGSLKRVKFSPDGRRLAVVTMTDARIWDLAAGRAAVTLKDLGAGIEDAWYSPDGKRLACVLSSKKLRVWDAATGQEQLTIDLPREYLRRMCYRPDGKQLAAVGKDPVVHVWDTANGKELFSCAGDAGGMFAIGYSPDGKRLAVTCWNGQERTGEVRLWDADTGRLLTTMKGRSRGADALCFSPDGRYLVTANTNAQGKRGELTVWHVATGREVATFTGHEGHIGALTFTPDGRRLATASVDKTLRLWDPFTGQETLRLQTGEFPVEGLDFSPDGSRLVTGGGTVQLWEATARQEVFALAGPTGFVSAVGFSTDGRWLAAGSDDTTVRVWDLHTGQEATALRGHTAAVWGVAFAPDGRRLASAGQDQSVKVWDRLTGQLVYSIKAGAGRNCSPCFSPDGKWLAAPGPDNTVLICDAETGREIHRSKADRFPIAGLCFSPDGKRLVSPAMSLRFWNVPSGEEIPMPPGPLEMYTASCYSRDGKYLAAASVGFAQIWDTRTGQRVQLLSRPGGLIGGLCFTPNCRYLVLAATQDVVTVWDVATGKQVLDLPGKLLWSAAVSASPDGKYLAAPGPDDTVRLWDLPALLRQVPAAAAADAR
jgi:WD40 repeat protein/serine/threonine protein kinase